MQYRLNTDLGKFARLPATSEAVVCLPSRVSCRLNPSRNVALLVGEPVHTQYPFGRWQPPNIRGGKTGADRPHLEPVRRKVLVLEPLKLESEAPGVRVDGDAHEVIVAAVGRRSSAAIGTAVR
jgi:hypothetical protein